jgi:hypothetical protein
MRRRRARSQPELIAQAVAHLRHIARGMAMYITRASLLYAQPHILRDPRPTGWMSMKPAWRPYLAHGRADGFRDAVGRLRGHTHRFQPVQNPGRVHVAATGTYANRRSQ